MPGLLTDAAIEASSDTEALDLSLFTSPGVEDSAGLRASLAASRDRSEAPRHRGRIPHRLRRVTYSARCGDDLADEIISV